MNPRGSALALAALAALVMANQACLAQGEPGTGAGDAVAHALGFGDKSGHPVAKSPAAGLLLVTVAARGHGGLLLVDSVGAVGRTTGKWAGLTLFAPNRAGAGDAPIPAALPPKALDPLIDEAAREFGHDPELLRAIINVESRFNPRAVSNKGAIGLMQLLPATAASMGLEDPSRMLFDPRANVRTGARYLRKLCDIFLGRIDLAVAAYNAGEGAVQRYNEVPPFPETQNYVRNVMALYGGAKAP